MELSRTFAHFKSCRNMINFPTGKNISVNLQYKACNSNLN